MDALLESAKSIRHTAEGDATPLLSAVSSRRPARDDEQNTTIATAKPAKQIIKKEPADVSTPEDSLEILRSGPDEELALSQLKRLLSDDGFQPPFALHIPGPVQAQIISVIIDIIIPTFWQSWSIKNRSLLLSCLSSVAGVNAVFARLKRLTQARLQSNAQEGEIVAVQELMQVAQQLLKDKDSISRVWRNLARQSSDPIKLQLAWKELVQLVGSGRITGISAETEAALFRCDNVKQVEASWLSSGPGYAAWLGSAIVAMLEGDESSSLSEVMAAEGTAELKQGIEAITQKRNMSTDAATGLLLAKALSLGYPIPLVKSIISDIMSEEDDVRIELLLNRIISHLPNPSKKKFFEHVLRFTSTLLDDEGPHAPEQLLDRPPSVSAVAALITSFIKNDTVLKDHLLHFLSDASLASSISFDTRRASICAIASAVSDDLGTLLSNTITLFAESMFINHAPSHQQDSLAQVLLLAAGTLHRKTPMAVFMAARSSGHMQGVSRRLDTSNQRARWLGMVVGTALSNLIDKPGSKMSFGTEDMETEEARWYFKLVNVLDSASSLQEFGKLLKERSGQIARRRKQAAKAIQQEMPLLGGKRMFGPVRPPVPPPAVQTEVVGEKISELVDDDDEESDEDEDLKPYAKPDSDPEDSDEDATLVNRNKPRPPVYIRDLMKMLRDDKSHDRFQLAMAHAAILIRKKANFGKEVTDHAEELASILSNLQDPFETPNFDELKLQALIAVLLSDVETMAPWVARQAFIGEYSIAQRCVLLTALGLGGRELAGIREDDNTRLNPLPSPESVAFPSKRLPERLHANYSPQSQQHLTATKQIQSTSRRVEHELLHPMALSAADETTSHLNAVKVRTFSSRLTSQRNPSSSPNPSTNRLSKIFASAFFTPLLSRYQQDIAAYSSGSLFSSVPFLLITFLKTLALLLHASGPATLHLSDITTAFWDLLLSLRTHAARDISVLEAVLFGLLTLLNINVGGNAANASERVMRENARQIAETQEWTSVVFESVGGGELGTGGSEEEVKVRTLSAAVLVKLKEIGEVFQKRLFGRT